MECTPNTKYIMPLGDFIACDTEITGDSPTGDGKCMIPLQKGFLISRKACMEFLRRRKNPPEHFLGELSLAIRELERSTCTSFRGNDDTSAPLMLSLRSFLPSEEYRLACLLVIVYCLDLLHLPVRPELISDICFI
jgi:hypothetical protein